MKTMEAAPSMSWESEQKLKAMILSGEIKIGQQLPTERELAEALHVSKGVVHAAITELARKGFLKIVPRHGVYVADYIKNGSLAVLGSIVDYNGGVIDKQLAESIIKTRLALEGAAVFDIAEKHNEGQITRLRVMLYNVRSAAEKGEINTSRALAEKLQDMYLAKCVMSGNQLIPILVNASAELSIMLTQMWIDSVGFNTVFAGLERTMAFVAAGDAMGALKNMRLNFDSAIKALYN